jgi:hypothetical protein
MFLFSIMPQSSLVYFALFSCCRTYLSLTIHHHFPIEVLNYNMKSLRSIVLGCIYGSGMALCLVASMAATQHCVGLYLWQLHSIVLGFISGNCTARHCVICEHLYYIFNSRRCNSYQANYCFCLYLRT